jgi:hypothetical protein
MLKLDRTNAELAGEERITTGDVADDLQYRPRLAEN